MTTRTELNLDQNTLYALLPRNGGSISNKALQDQLGWDAERYYATRDSLVDIGLVVRGRGRGGTVRLYIPPPSIGDTGTLAEPAENAAEVEDLIRSEVNLYEPMCAVIESDWARDHRSDPLAVEITALQGRRATGGTWSRPDIVSVEVRTYPYVPGKYLEVTTYEVKPVRAVGVQAVYEALAHRRAATHSYVVLHTPREQHLTLEKVVDDICELARSHGIGVVTVDDPSDYETWEERVEAERASPDPERLNDFISTQLSPQCRDRISRRLRLPAPATAVFPWLAPAAISAASTTRCCSSRSTRATSAIRRRPERHWIEDRRIRAASLRSRACRHGHCHRDLSRTGTLRRPLGPTAAPIRQRTRSSPAGKVVFQENDAAEPASRPRGEPDRRPFRQVMLVSHDLKTRPSRIPLSTRPPAVIT